jgi:endonuclease/exonuclease/phosphatase family metal-dependent hydrolase
LVYNTHLQHNHAGSRNEQVAAVLKHASTEVEAIVFVIGDMNYAAVPDTADDDSTGPDLLQIVREHGFHDLHAGFAKKRGKQAENTFPAENPDRRIDYIFCNRPLEVVDAYVVNTLVSDHLPLVVTVRLPAE